MKYITGHALTKEEAQARFEKVIRTNKKNAGMGFYSVQEKGQNMFVGIAKLVHVRNKQAEVGYGSLPEFWGKKIASEMLRCLVEYARTLPQYKELIGIVHPKNSASKKVLANQSFELYEKGFEDGRPVEYYKLVL